MELVIRKNSLNEWGFVETYSTYYYENSGSVSFTVGIDRNGKFSKPYTLRGGMFVPLSQIEDEMTIGRFLKAKKPIYSMLKDNIIVCMKVYMNYETGEYVPEKSDYVVYMVSEKKEISEREARLKCNRVMEVPSILDSAISKLMVEFCKYRDDRDKFLKARI